MKNKIGQYLIAGIFVLICSTAMSQNKIPKLPDWLSDKGYWVVEGNLHQSLQYTIRFYNNDNVLVGIKRISGSPLKLTRRKTKMELKSVLESSLVVWAVEKTAAQTYLANTP